MEDPEEAFNRKRQGLGGMEGLQPMEMVGSRTPSRLSGDVAMAASNTSADGTLRLRKVVWCGRRCYCGSTRTVYGIMI